MPSVKIYVIRAKYFNTAFPVNSAKLYQLKNILE